MRASDLPINTCTAAAALLDVNGIDGERLKSILVQSENPTWLKVSEVVDLLKVDRQFVIHLIKEETFFAARVGKRYLISESSLQAWLAGGGGAVRPYSRASKEKQH